MQLITVVYECAYCSKIIKTEFEKVHTIEDNEEAKLKNVPVVCEECRGKVLNQWDDGFPS